MKTITMYELLGMIKDGKAPKKVRYDTIEYEFNGKDYINEFGVNLLKHLNYAEYIMTHKIEILEEKKKPEKISPLSASDILDIIGTKYTKAQDKALQNLFEHIRNQDKKINEIIDCLDYLKSKGDE